MVEKNIVARAMIMEFLSERSSFESSNASVNQWRVISFIGHVRYSEVLNE
jgi:hypothetical protein